MIPSLLQIPSAVSDSKLHSVLPNNGKGDFTFDRSTGATRINRDGLIEEVGYFSSELVQNGDFSELGSDIVNNGSFSGSSTEWTESGTWAYGNNNEVCVGNGTNQVLTQSGILTNGKTYKYSIDIISSTLSSQQIRVYLGGTDYVSYTLNGGAETISAYGQSAGANLAIRVTSSNTSGTLTIDNVSVKQVDPNDRWILSNFLFGENKVTFTDTAGGAAYQSGLTLTSGKKYKLTFTISESLGNANIWIGNSVGGVNYEGASYRTFTNGNHTIVFNMPSDQTTLAFYGNTNGTSFSISNISLVEVQGDRPRLSYDITNGVVEDKPHLLLEPSATNLVTFSEDFSQSVWSKANISVSDNTIISPDGTQNASTITTSNTSHSLFFNFTSVASTQYTLSFYAKRGTMTDLKYRVYDLSNDGDIVAPTSYYAQTNSDRWERITLTFTTPSGCTSARVYPVSNSGVTGTMFLFGCMVEQQSYATSYIPTAGTTITRAAETCNNSKPSVNSTEGVLYAEIQGLTNGTTGDLYISISDNSVSNSVALILHNTANRVNFRVYDGGSLEVNISDLSTNQTQNMKVACKYKSGNYALWINGTESVTASSGSLPSGLTEISFNDGAGSNSFYGKVKGLAVYNEALSESQLMQLTGVTASSIYNNFVTRTATFTVEALNEVKKVIDNL